jgi:hypothetical protein
MQVVKDALSASANNGYDEFHQMNLAEAYLHANGGGTQYDSTLRWMAFLNEPTNSGPWMLQFGGHHYAANIAFNNGHVIGATPFFMGLEPISFTYNNVSYDPLGDERDAFRAALASLSSTQLSTLVELVLRLRNDSRRNQRRHLYFPFCYARTAAKLAHHRSAKFGLGHYTTLRR